MKPSDFKKFPWASVLKIAEAEVVALNIMKILSRTGNEWRELSWDEYMKERLTDGNFSKNEEEYFNKVKDYCVSAETARLFSKDWRI